MVFEQVIEGLLDGIVILYHLYATTTLNLVLVELCNTFLCTFGTFVVEFGHERTCRPIIVDADTALRVHNHCTGLYLVAYLVIGRDILIAVVHYRGSSLFRRVSQLLLHIINPLAQ